MDLGTKLTMQAYLMALTMGKGLNAEEIEGLCGYLRIVARRDYSYQSEIEAMLQTLKGIPGKEAADSPETAGGRDVTVDGVGVRGTITRNPRHR